MNCMSSNNHYRITVAGIFSIASQVAGMIATILLALSTDLANMHIVTILWRGSLYAGNIQFVKHCVVSTLCFALVCVEEVHELCLLLSTLQAVLTQKVHGNINY